MKRSLLFPIAIAKRISQCAANLVESTTNNSFGKRSNQLLGLCKHLALLNHLILLQKVDQITQFVKCLLSITLDSQDHLLRLQQIQNPSERSFHQVRFWGFQQLLHLETTRYKCCGYRYKFVMINFP